MRTGKSYIEKSIKVAMSLEFSDIDRIHSALSEQVKRIKEVYPDSDALLGESNAGSYRVSDIVSLGEKFEVIYDEMNQMWREGKTR